MDKILYVTDAVRLNRSCVEFACYLCNLTHSHLTGVFLENRELELRSHEQINEIAAIPSIPGGRFDEQKELYRDDSIRRFTHTCGYNGVNCITHINPGIPLTEVVTESRYADLIVVDAASSFKWKEEGMPSTFALDLLKHSECPVFIAPDNFNGVEEIVFAFNGSATAMFAIKQFTYLFPELSHHKATLLVVSENGRKVDNEVWLKEWLDDHYDDVAIDVQENARAGDGLLEQLFKKDNAIIVMGAFGRSALSELFIPNPGNAVVRMVNQPIFIAHA